MIKSVDIKILITLHCKYLLLFTAILHLFLYIRPEEPSIQPPHDSDVVILVARPHSVPPPLHLGPDVAAPVVLLLRLAPQLQKMNIENAVRSEVCPLPQHSPWRRWEVFPWLSRTDW